MAPDLGEYVGRLAPYPVGADLLHRVLERVERREHVLMLDDQVVHPAGQPRRMLEQPRVVAVRAFRVVDVGAERRLVLRDGPGESGPPGGVTDRRADRVFYSLDAAEQLCLIRHGRTSAASTPLEDGVGGITICPELTTPDSRDSAPSSAAILSGLLAGAPVAVAIQLVDVRADHADRTLHVRRSVARAARTVDVGRDR